MEEAASRLSEHSGGKQLDSDNWTRLAQALTEVACCLLSSFTQSHRQPIGSTTQPGTTSQQAEKLEWRPVTV